MKFVPIFGNDYCLLSVKGDDETFNEFDRIFNNWTDIEYLHEFFTTHEADLKRPFWEGISIEQAIIETRNEAIWFRQKLRKVSNKSPLEKIEFLLKLFKPLSKDSLTTDKFLEKKKVYGTKNKTWLRIYALKAGDNLYIITGGAIKLTDNMSEREHTKVELSKLDACKRFIIEEGIVDEDGVIELIGI